MKLTQLKMKKYMVNVNKQIVFVFAKSVNDMKRKVIERFKEYGYVKINDWKVI